MSPENSLAELETLASNTIYRNWLEISNQYFIGRDLKLHVTPSNENTIFRITNVDYDPITKQNILASVSISPSANIKSTFNRDEYETNYEISTSEIERHAIANNFVIIHNDIVKRLQKRRKILLPSRYLKNQKNWLDNLISQEIKNYFL